MNLARCSFGYGKSIFPISLHHGTISCVVHALIISFVDKITFVILDLRQTTLNLVVFSTPKSLSAIHTHRRSSSSSTFYKRLQAQSK